MRLLFFTTFLFSTPVLAADDLRDYNPPPMFDVAIEEVERFPPLPLRKPDHFFVSKAYVQELMARQSPEKTKLVKLSARDVLRSIEE